MKQIFLLSFFLLVFSFVHAQTIVENPKTGMSTANNLKLEKVEISDTSTILFFHIRYQPNNWISIPKGTYIQPAGSEERFYATGTIDIPFDKKYTMPESGEKSYAVIFPKIDPATAKIDFGEGNDGGSWFIYDIQLKPELFQSLVPEKLSGNWFNGDNAQWEISLFDSVAIYKSQVWNYINYTEDNGLGKIELKHGGKTMNLYAKSVDENTCMLGETPKSLKKYSSQPDESVMAKDQEEFQSPVFKVDTMTYRGYFRGFSPRFPQRTGMIYVNDVITGEQVSHLVKIEDDGTFEVRFTHCNPQGVFVRLPFSEGVFLEPGRTTFQLIDPGSEPNQVLFMGDCARINNDLQKLKKIRGYDYREMQQKILDFSPEQYKVWCKDLWQKDLDSLSSFAQKYPLSGKALQVKKLELNYRYASLMMEYQMNSVSAWRQKNKIPRNQRKIDFEPAKPDSSYYDFLTNDLINNPLAVMLPDYYFFINRIKYSEIFRGQPKGLTTSEIMDELKKSGYEFKPEELELAEKMKEAESPEVTKLQQEFQDKYGEQMRNFHQKYGDKLMRLYGERKTSVIAHDEMETYLSEQGIELTKDEKALLVASDEHNSNPAIKQRNDFNTQYKDAINKFHSDHRLFVGGLHMAISREQRNENMQRILGIEPGLAIDLMTAQDYCRSIVSEMTPVSDEELQKIQQQFSTPFIADYVALLNENAKAKVEANKTLTGSTLNEVPKTEGDKVFDAIMEKYKGKVVYVDFWATWCSPCRSGIEKIKPLKDELEGEDVVFVYITNQTSPKGTYDNMIPGIKGEHYRVSADEWNILSGKFNISGIPHYTLVGKDGQVINPHLGHLENSQLKALLMKHIKE